MSRKFFSFFLLSFFTCCLTFAAARPAVAEEQTTHIEGVVSFDDNDNSRGLRPDKLPIVVATRKASDQSYSDNDFGGTRTVKVCYVSASTNWRYDADVPTRDADDNELVPVIAIVYSLDADDSELPPYAVTKSGNDFKLTYRPHTFDIPVTIKWVDENNADGVRPSSLSFSINCANFGSVMGLGSIWKAEGDNTDSVTSCGLKNQKLYGSRIGYVDGSGNAFSTRATFNDWTVMAQLGNTQLALGQTVEGDGYSYSMTERLSEDNVPSFEIVAVHEPKKGSELGGGQTEPDDTKKDNQKGEDQRKNIGSDDDASMKTADKKNAGTAAKPKTSGSSLPNTGDSSTSLIGLIVIFGMALFLVGTRAATTSDIFGR